MRQYRHKIMSVFLIFPHWGFQWKHKRHHLYAHEFSHFSHCVFKSFHSIQVYISSDFPKCFFKEFDIVTNNSNELGGVL
jgi:hypothetical protein